jgi:hypothetical protein
MGKHGNSCDVAKTNARRVAPIMKAEAEFVAYLEELTRQKKARWVRSSSEPGFILCQVSGELLIFESGNGTGEQDHVDPDGEVAGIHCRFHSWFWAWLTALEEGERMLRLLRKAEINDQKFVKWKARAYRSGLDFLKNALNGKKG